MFTRSFFEKKQILITGHTGFIGSWLTSVFLSLGAKVIGISLDPPTKPNLFSAISLDKNITDLRCDIRDYSHLNEIIRRYQPEILVHLAAQPMVLTSYDSPLDTFSTNIMGTANLLQTARGINSLKALIIMTSDKVYKNVGDINGFTESSPLGGKDPYSASKSCQDILSNSFRESYFRGAGVGLSVVRAGNVIGGGDWGKNRLVVDLINSLQKNEPLTLRYPNAIRPWQHVLEPIFGILKLIYLLMKYPDKYSSDWNFGPEKTMITVAEFARAFALEYGIEQKLIIGSHVHPEEKTLLLQTTKTTNELEFCPFWDTEKAIKETVLWYKSYYNGKNMVTFTNSQIAEYLKNAGLF